MIFVVDSTDIERLGTAAEELSAMLNEGELRDAALLVFANKQDQPGAKGAGEISEAMRLGELKDRNWTIMACSAVDGKGINEGMDWMVVCSRLGRRRRYLRITNLEKTTASCTARIITIHNLSLDICPRITEGLARARVSGFGFLLRYASPPLSGHTPGHYSASRIMYVTQSVRGPSIDLRASPVPSGASAPFAVT